MKFTYRLIPIMAILIAIPSMVLNILLLKSKSLPPRAQYFPGYKVTAVIDGDTFVTEDKSIIRFDTLDAPELQFCGGLEAKSSLEKMILGKNVKIASQVRDVNGRQIASVWLGETWVDKKLIETGWVAYSSSTVDAEHILKNLDLSNRQKNLGIYSPQCTQYTNAVNPKCTIKGNISGEWNNKGRKIYHTRSCVQYQTVRVELYRGEQWFCTESEAKKAGYIKSTRCP